MSPPWIVALAAVAAYLPSFGGAFQFDDYNVIVGSPVVQSWSALLEHAGGGVRPLLKASYTLSWTMGLGVLGFHVVNIAVHALNCVLAYAVGRALCERWNVRHHGAALAAALLFALHPAQVEAVTYVSGRSSSLMASFYLGAVLVYLRGGHWRWSALLFVLAAATKETALTLPAALLLCELCTPGSGWKNILRRQGAHWMVLLAAVAVLLLHARYFELLTFGFTRRDVADNLLTQVGGVSYLVLRLVGLHGYNIDPALPVLSAWTPVLAVQAALLAALVGLGVANIRRRPWIGFGILWFFLQLAPTNSLVPRLDVANDRQLYLACWGLFLALAVQAAPALPRPRALALALAALFAVASAWRQLDYRSEIALWESDVRKAPWNARAHNNLGYAYQQAGLVDAARREYEAAELLDPGGTKARINLLLLAK